MDYYLGLFNTPNIYTLTLHLEDIIVKFTPLEQSKVPNVLGGVRWGNWLKNKILLKKYKILLAFP